MTTPASRARAAGGSDRKFVSALARGLEVLRAFTPTEGLLGNGELVARNRPAQADGDASHPTLTKLGYLTYVERLGKYQLAPAALALGYSALANMRIRQLARGPMQKLADYADASIALGTRDRLDLIYVEHCRSKHGMMLRLGLGSRIPIATTAMGRALIAGLPETERDWLLGYLRREAGKGWPKLRGGIERAIEDVATRGFTLAARRMGARHQRGQRARLLRVRRLRRFRVQLQRAVIPFHRATGSNATSARGSSTWCATSRWNSRRPLKQEQ